jgi:hypothetical protein
MFPVLVVFMLVSWQLSAMNAAGRAFCFIARHKALVTTVGAVSFGTIALKKLADYRRQAIFNKRCIPVVNVLGGDETDFPQYGERRNGYDFIDPTRSSNGDRKPIEKPRSICSTLLRSIGSMLSFALRFPRQ